VKAKTSEKEQRPEVKRMNLNVETNLHDRFKAATAAKGTNMTDVIIKFIKDYVNDHGVRPLATKKEARKQ
jgi:predicted HicB family RNase H-like nuclease